MCNLGTIALEHCPIGFLLVYRCYTDWVEFQSVLSSTLYYAVSSFFYSSIRSLMVPTVPTGTGSLRKRRAPYGLLSFYEIQVILEFQLSFSKISLCRILLVTALPQYSLPLRIGYILR